MDADIKAEIKDVLSFINENRTTIVTIAEDKMSATLNLIEKEDKTPYTVEEILDFLKEQGVVAGFLEDEINRILEEKLYGRNVQVAIGKEPEDGENAFYKYHFNVSPRSAPQLLPDGSVDYRNMKYFEAVTEGQLIAELVDETLGTDGYKVTGEVIPCHRGRPVPMLRGRFIMPSADRKAFFSEINGKIELDSAGRIIITNVMVVSGDVDVSTGNISFGGNLEIAGCVRSGFQVEVGGSVTINGVVESAVIKAGKDVIIKSGMMGGGKGVVIAGGNVEGKFFENTNIDVEGYLHANVLMGSYVNCNDEIVISGNHGVIIGGRTRALKGITIHTIGNSVEVPTYVKAGYEPKMVTTLNKKYTDLKAVTKELEGLEKIQETLALIQLTPDKQKEYTEKKTMVMRSKIVKVTEQENLKMECEKLQHEIEIGKDGKVVVTGKVYGGSMITINGINLMVREEVKNVTFVIKNGKVVMIAN